MSCDFVDKHDERCFKEHEIERDFYHPNHDEYVGQPDSPFILYLCSEHKDEEITWEMIQKSHEILLEFDKG